MTSFSWDNNSNDVAIGENINITGSIVGKGNIVQIESTRKSQNIAVFINGNDNHIRIGHGAVLNHLRIDIGSRNWKSSNTKLTVGDNFSIASQSRFLLPNSGNIIDIGKDCMFSNNITVRAGEYPHLIFDLENGAYLDVSDGIFIGDHVWIGEGVYINKGVTLKRECIVGARSVVTRRFAVENAVIAGNPARVVKENVQWVGNERLLDAHPALVKNFEDTELYKINQSNR